MAANLLWLNGVDANDLGFTLVEAPGLLATPPQTPQTVQVPQAAGVLVSGAPVGVGSRVLRLSGYCEGATISAATVVLDRIKAAVAGGVVDIRTGWATSIVHRGLLLTHDAGPNARAWLGQVAMELEFLLPDPYGYAIEPTTVSFGATATAIPLGTAPSVGREWWSAIITISGAATTPTLTEYDASGTALRTMAFTTSPGASDAIEIDVGRGLVTAVASSTRTNGMANLSAGFEFPRLDPNDGDWYASAWPKLAVSSGSASIRYYKGYR